MDFSSHDEFVIMPKIDKYLQNLTKWADQNRKHPKFQEIRSLGNACIDIRNNMHLHLTENYNQINAFTRQNLIRACLSHRISFVNEEQAKADVFAKIRELIINDNLGGDLMCSIDQQALTNLKELMLEIDKLKKNENP